MNEKGNTCARCAEPAACWFEIARVPAVGPSVRWKVPLCRAHAEAPDALAWLARHALGKAEPPGEAPN